ncbi:MAG: PP0621 family protein [Gammaproteobacteria bacterium]
MVRSIVLIVAIWLAITIIRQMLRNQRPEPKPRSLPTGNMVRCAHCGLHIPQDEALRNGEDYYCSERHRLAGK